MLPYYSQRSNLIKLLSNYGEAKKMAHDWQIVRAKENLKFSHGGPVKDKHQAPTDRLVLYVRAVIDSES